jgi:glutamate-1-semialdehyde 2,1-aminomutase
VHIGHYDPNDIGSLESLLRTHAGSVAAVFVSPFRHDVFRDQTTPDAIFAKAVRRCCDESGALLVLDDIRAGFRLARDGSWEALGVRPDLSTWGKSIANGYALSALLGSESLRESARLPYVTGSFWFSATAMAAATETLRQIKTTNYLEHIVDMGSRLRAGLKQQAGNYGFALRQSGPVQMPQILFEDDPDFRFGYAWVGECVQRGVYLHPFHNMFLSAAHGEPELAATLKATDDAFAKLKERRATLKPNTKLSAFAAR